MYCMHINMVDRIFHTLDKNGSLYDPAGTESWNMQIRTETQKLTMHPMNNRSSPRLRQQCNNRTDSSNWVLQVHIRTSPDASPENVGVFVGSDPTDSATAPCTRFKKGEDRRKKKREVLHLFRCYTHTPGQSRCQPWKARGRKKADTRRAKGQKQCGGGRGTDGPPNQPTRRNGPDQNSART